MSKIEAGNLSVSDDLVDQLSRTLHYPKIFFFEPGDIYPLGLNYYRKAKGVSSRDLRAIEANVNIRRYEIEKLLRSVDIAANSKIPSYDIDDDRFGSPDAIARGA
jgi:hypothetical protein